MAGQTWQVIAMSKPKSVLGRPTTLTPEIAERLRELVEDEMLSVTAAAGVLKVHERQIYRWAAENEAFRHVYEMAVRGRLANMERLHVNLTREGKPTTGTIWMQKNAARRIAEREAGKEASSREWFDDHRTVLANDAENPLDAVLAVTPTAAKKIDADLEEDI